MSLVALRRVVLPGARTARSALLSVLLMASVALGLVAMHDSGSEHVVHAAVSTADTGAHVDQHGGDDATLLADTMTAVMATATAVAAECGSDCAADLLGCAAAALACAMMIAFGILLALASRPAMFRRLLDAGAVRLAARDIFGGHRRPDLHVLSISRT